MPQRESTSLRIAPRAPGDSEGGDLGTRCLLRARDHHPSAARGCGCQVPKPSQYPAGCALAWAYRGRNVEPADLPTAESLGIVLVAGTRGSGCSSPVSPSAAHATLQSPQARALSSARLLERTTSNDGRRPISKKSTTTHPPSRNVLSHPARTIARKSHLRGSPRRPMPVLNPTSWTSHSRACTWMVCCPIQMLTRSQHMVRRLRHASLWAKVKGASFAFPPLSRPADSAALTICRTCRSSEAYQLL
jgi:hypothetical protein